MYLYLVVIRRYLICLRLRSHRQFKTKNGPLDCVQKNYHISDKLKANDNKNEKLPEKCELEILTSPQVTNRFC